MAQKVTVSLTDDLDGGAADETVIFGLDGRTFEIDLSAKNAAALRKALDKFVAAGRTSGAARAGRRGRSVGRAAKSSSAVDPKAVRAWATDNGIEISARGRIPSTVIEKYLNH